MVLNTPHPQDLARLDESLRAEGAPSADYLMLVVAACVLATLGLQANNTVAVLGAMLVAPLMLPIRSLAFGALRGEPGWVKAPMLALALGVLLSIGISWAMGMLVAMPEYGSEVMARTSPNLFDLGVALVSGLVAGVAKLRPRISDAFVGTAIAVALMPPLCTVGLSLALGEGGWAWGAFLLFATNLVGILLACMLAFAQGGLANWQAHTWRAFAWTLGLTALLAIPLGLSFARLVAQAQQAALAKHLLVHGTNTLGGEVTLLGSRVDWSQKPPELHLIVRGSQRISPKQVGLLEGFLAARTGQRFALVVEFSRLELVRAEREATPGAGPALGVLGLQAATAPPGPPLAPGAAGPAKP